MLFNSLRLQRRCLLTIFLCHLALLLHSQSEFDPGGYNALRIENEIKLVVPRAQQDAVWAYLLQRYADPSPFLLGIDSAMHAKLAEDRFVDQYFDNLEFQLVTMESGIRHRARRVLTDSSNRKNGRELMQIKVNHIDGNALNRGEFKYPVKHYKPGGKEAEHDYHPFLGLVKRKHRAAIMERLNGLGIDPLHLEPTILITQLRKRVYILHDTSAFATITLDIDSAFYMDDVALFTELEMELNEIAYTEADSSTRQHMEAVNDLLMKDLLRQFPEIHQDQTPKYNKAAAQFSIDPAHGKFGKRRFPWRTVAIVAIPVGIVLLVWWLFRLKEHNFERRKQEFIARAARQSQESAAH